MPTDIPCKCGVTLRLPDDAAGRPVRCPQCREVITPPAPPPAALPVARAPQPKAAVEVPPAPPPPKKAAATDENATTYGVEGEAELTHEQETDRARAKNLVVKARRKRQEEEDEDEDEDRPRRRDRNDPGVFEGTYYHRPRLLMFISAIVFFLGVLVWLASASSQTTPNTTFVIARLMGLTMFGFIIFDILRGGGRDTYWRI